MTTTTTYKTPEHLLLEAIDLVESGAIDKQLDRLEHAIVERLNTMRCKRTVNDFSMSQTVRFNNLCGTGYLRGLTATVVGKSRKKLKVVLDKPVGRFVRVVDGISMSVEIAVPPSIIDPK